MKWNFITQYLIPAIFWIAAAAASLGASPLLNHFSYIETEYPVGACRIARGRTSSLLLPGPTDFPWLPCADYGEGKFLLGIGTGFCSTLRYRADALIGNSLRSNVVQPMYVAAGFGLRSVFFHILYAGHSPMRLDCSLPIFDQGYSPGQVGNEVLRCRGGVNTFTGSLSLHFKSLHLGISSGIRTGKLHLSYREQFFPPEIADRRFDFTSKLRRDAEWRFSLGWSCEKKRAFWLTFVSGGYSLWKDEGATPAGWTLPETRIPREIRIGFETRVPVSIGSMPDKNGKVGHVISEVTIKLAGLEFADLIHDIRHTDSIKPGLRCGVEVPISGNFSAFAGFFLSPSCRPRVTDRVAFSSGFSIPLRRATWRVGAEISWRDYPEEEAGILKGVVEEKVIQISSEIIFYR